MSDYTWAKNKTKLFAARERVVNAKKLDASVEVSEEAIKAEYIKLAGIVIDESEIPAVVEAEVEKPRRRSKKSE